MADPLTISVSTLAIITAAIKSTKSLYGTIQRFRDRDKTLRRLQDEIEDLTKILTSLTQVDTEQEAMLVLLQGPIKRCDQICRDFERSMSTFGGRSKATPLDWAKMEFMKGDINEFIEVVAGYKSTISVGLGTITLHNSKVSRQVLQDYTEKVKDTAYSLELHLRRIDEKMTRLILENANASSISVDLEDERAVTKQCLTICKDASSYIESLKNRQSSIFQEGSPDAVENTGFEAQLRTRQALNDNLDSFAQTIVHLQKRLVDLINEDGSGNENERSRLQSDIDASKQCLDICKVASEISRQKVYRVGEVIADGESDQVVVTTLADLFDVKKAWSKGNSAQLVGSMAADELRLMTEKRYDSRFGTAASHSEHTGAPALDTREPKDTSPGQAAQSEHFNARSTKHQKPSPNEMRKRLSSEGP